MKKILMSVAALSMVAPSVASAQTAAQALSVKSAAVAPVRAAAKAGEAKAVGTPILILAVVAAVGGIVALASSGSDSK